MSDKPEALLLAGQLESGEPVTGSAVAVLRRLHEVNQELLEALKEAHNALELFASDESPSGQIAVAAVMQARAAIAKATGE